MCPSVEPSPTGTEHSPRSLRRSVLSTPDAVPFPSPDDRPSADAAVRFSGVRRPSADAAGLFGCSRCRPSSADVRLTTQPTAQPTAQTTTQTTTQRKALPHGVSRPPTTQPTTQTTAHSTTQRAAHHYIKNKKAKIGERPRTRPRATRARYMRTRDASLRQHGLTAALPSLRDNSRQQSIILIGRPPDSGASGGNLWL